MGENKTPLIYVSGKYTNGIISKNIDDAEAVAVQLMRNGFDVICPHKNTAFYEKYEDIPYEKYIEMDLNILERCDVIYMMDNWKESNGAKIEMQYAMDKGMPVIFGENHNIEEFTVEAYDSSMKLITGGE
jgi:nucleoside 2-deoxyribosyltransferase